MILKKISKRTVLKAFGRGHFLIQLSSRWITTFLPWYIQPSVIKHDLHRICIEK